MTLPIELDSFDVSILKSLFKDGRKSFRQVSRELAYQRRLLRQDLRDW